MESTGAEVGRPAAAASDTAPRPAARAAAGTTPLFANPAPVARRIGPPLVVLAIDAEEDFDWLRPLPGTDHATGCMRHLGDLQSITGAYGLPPCYLLTWPVLQDEEAMQELRPHLERGACSVGLQLHAWVTPPLQASGDLASSYACNLPPALEAAKLETLAAAFQARFSTPPRSFRAGRYGIGAATTRLLEQLGFTVDVSLAANTNSSDDGGPDFSAHDCSPFWFGERRRLLEVPLCRSIVGWAGGLGQRLYRAIEARPSHGRLAAHYSVSLLARAHAAERLTLSPEGHDLAAMCRLARGLISRGEPVLAISLHSSSLQVGRSPYVRSRAELHRFYDRFSGLLAFLADEAGCRFVTLERLPDLLGGVEGQASNRPPPRP